MTVKLSYFNMTGLGEPVRLILAYGNIKFDDNRVTKEQWAEEKKGMRWPHLPKLEIEDKELHQSKTICRYLAKKLNLCGKSEWQATYCDMMVDTLDDFRGKVVSTYYSPDSEERTEKLQNLRENFVPMVLSKFEEHVMENNGFFIDGKLTWADIIFYAFSEYVSYMIGEDLIPNYPKLKAIQNHVASQPGISKYLQTRPPPPKDMREIFA